MKYCTLKPKALDMLLAPVPAGARITQACWSSVEGGGEFIRIEWIPADEIGKEKPKRQSALYPPEMVRPWLKDCPDDAVLVGVMGIYEYPELPDGVVKLVPEGHEVYNVEYRPQDAPAGAPEEQQEAARNSVLVRTRGPGGALFDFGVSLGIENAKICRQWRKFKDLHVRVRPAE